MGASRPLVGRSGELRALARALQPGATDLRVVAIAGEAGIGKTRLLEEIAPLAHGRGVRLGRATELERHAPFAAVVDAFRDFDDGERGRIAAMRDDERGQLASIFPSLADLGDARADGLHRYHAQHAIRRLLEVLAGRGPLVLALDDLHWADDATLELLGYLLRNPPGAPLVLVLAYRPAELARPVHGALDEAERADAVVRLGLEPLSRAAADELVGPGIARDLRDSLYRESGGNPLYLEHLLAALGRAPTGSDVGDDPRLPSVPAAMRRALAAELEALPPEAALSARAGAVLGETFALDGLAAVADLELAAAGAAVDRLVEADLVRPTGSPELRFRHPIVRRAIYEDAPPGWRTAAHARADAALAERGASPLERAPHVERSASPGDQAAVGLLVAAAAASAPHAPAIAARWFEAARRLLPADSAAEELGLLPPLGMCLGLAGQLRESREVLGRALDRLAASGAPGRGALAAFTASVDHFLGRHDDARALLEAALAEAPPGESDAAMLLTELAWDRWFQGDWRAIGDDAARALEAARAAGEPALIAIATAFAAMGQTSLGDIDAAAPLVRDAAGIVDGLDDAALSARLMALFAVGVSEGLFEDYPAARRHFVRGAELARRTGQETQLVMFEGGAALAETYLGDLPDAREHLTIALDIAQIYGLEHMLGWTESIHCLWALRAGEAEAAAAANARAERAFAAMALAPLAQQACECADAWFETMPAAAVSTRLLELAGGPSLEALPPCYRTVACEVLSRAALESGAGEEAAAWAVRAREAATALAVLGEAAACRAEARVALSASAPERAAELALRSATAAASRGAEVEALRGRLLAGQAFAQAGDHDAAIAELTEVHRGASARGARRLRDEAAGDLRRLGTPVGPPARRRRRGDGLAALTAREREVAELVTERLTNAEIGERLVLSPRTVERHLSRIYATLGISSRVELARRISREDA